MRYRKRPQAIEAEQYTFVTLMDWLANPQNVPDEVKIDLKVTCKTMEGAVTLTYGDWMLRSQNRCRIMSAANFEETYELAPEEQSLGQASLDVDIG